jgi:hypothetical protein
MRRSYAELLEGITWYRQYRVDHGVHTGIEANGTTLFEYVRPGKRDRDPVLLWYVDLRCKGEKLPKSPVEVRDWLLDHAPLIRAAFAEAADRLEVGFDADALPLVWPITDAPRGVQMKIVCHAVHRLVGRDIAEIVREIGEHWEENVKTLKEPPLRVR